jgi:flavodoxin
VTKVLVLYYSVGGSVKRMAEHMQSMSPEEMMKTWMPAGLQAWERMQEAFMSQFTGGPGPREKG